ncbi:MAG: methyltransferase domain-containing protein [Patescibacteria group bacterium]|jgi:2-polyprenyl-3-methyl-5-hydroxy-6-metoxy-1,4-benzoquinol methylase
MININERLENERRHGVYLAKSPEAIWGHASLAGRLRVDRRIDLFAKLAELKPGKRVCEIGCGTGLFTQALLEKTGAEIVGVDISPDLLRMAREKVSDPRATFLLGDCMEPKSLGVPLDFDAVVTNSVLHHLELSKALPAILLMLKPGGVFVCSEPNMLNPQIAIQKNIPFIKRWAGDSPDETAFFKRKLAKDMQKAGFVEVDIKSFDFLHPKLPDKLARVADKAFRFFESIPVIKEIAGSLIIAGKKPLI